MEKIQTLALITSPKKGTHIMNSLIKNLLPLYTFCIIALASQTFSQNYNKLLTNDIALEIDSFKIEYELGFSRERVWNIMRNGDILLAQIVKWQSEHMIIMRINNESEVVFRSDYSLLMFIDDGYRKTPVSRGHFIPQKIIEMQSWGYLVAGRIEQFSGSTDNRFFLLRLDAVGTPVWHKLKVMPYKQESVDLIKLSDGRFAAVYSVRKDTLIITSKNETVKKKKYGFVLLIINEKGDIDEQRIFLKENIFVKSIVESHDNGFYIIGSAAPYKEPKFVPHYERPYIKLVIARATGIILKTDRKGNIVWTWKPSETIENESTINRICLADDGSIIAAITKLADRETIVTDSFVVYLTDPQQLANLVKLDAEGIVIWEKNIGNSDIKLHGVQQLSKEEYLVTGRDYETEGWNGRTRVIYQISKVNNYGEVEWLVDNFPCSIKHIVRSQTPGEFFIYSYPQHIKPGFFYMVCRIKTKFAD